MIQTRYPALVDALRDAPEIRSSFEAVCGPQISARGTERAAPVYGLPNWIEPNAAYRLMRQDVLRVLRELVSSGDGFLTVDFVALGHRFPADTKRMVRRSDHQTNGTSSELMPGARSFAARPIRKSSLAAAAHLSVTSLLPHHPFRAVVDVY
jgi:hypothetical protein